MRIDAICSIFISCMAFVSIPVSGSRFSYNINSSKLYTYLSIFRSQCWIGWTCIDICHSLTGTFQVCIRKSAEVESFVRLLNALL